MAFQPSRKRAAGDDDDTGDAGNKRAKQAHPFTPGVNSSAPLTASGKEIKLGPPSIKSLCDSLLDEPGPENYAKYVRQLVECALEDGKRQNDMGKPLRDLRATISAWSQGDKAYEQSLSRAVEKQYGERMMHDSIASFGEYADACSSAQAISMLDKTGQGTLSITFSSLGCDTDTRSTNRAYAPQADTATEVAGNSAGWEDDVPLRHHVR